VGCQDLSEVIFESGSNIRYISGSEFENCNRLSSICIPSPVETVGALGFSGYSSLSPVTFELGSKLSKYESSAFANCQSLSKIRIPSSIRHVFHNYVAHLELTRDMPQGTNGLETGECWAADSVEWE
jgi:hypothetical protein